MLKIIETVAKTVRPQFMNAVPEALQVLAVQSAAGSTVRPHAALLDDLATIGHNAVGTLIDAPAS